MKKQFGVTMLATFLFIVTSGCTQSIKETNPQTTATPTESTSSSSNESSNTVSIIDKWHNVYEVTGGNEEFIMDIYRDGTALTAFLVPKASQENEMKFTGEITDDKISLSAFENGKEVARIEGVGGDPTTSDIVCTYKALANNSSQPIILKLLYASGGDSVDNRYSFIQNTQAVEDFVRDVKKDIISGEKQKLASKINYPITVMINGTSTSIQDANEFVSNYDGIITQNLKDAISNAYTKFMFSNVNGVLFGGNGDNMWISEFGDNHTLLIYAINNN